MQKICYHTEEVEPDLLHALGRVRNVVVCRDMTDCVQSACNEQTCAFVTDVEGDPARANAALLLCLKLKKQHPQFPVILLVPRNNIRLAVKAAKIGIHSIYEKPLTSEMITAIACDLSARIQKINKPLARQLTRTELCIIEHLLKGRTNKEIAELLNRSVRTVEEHRARIMRKMNITNLADLLKVLAAVGPYQQQK